MYKLTLSQRIRSLPRIMWYFMRGHAIAYNIKIVDGCFMQYGGQAIRIGVTVENTKQPINTSKKVTPYV